MTLVFVCSRLRGDYFNNIEFCKKACKFELIELKNNPFAPHLFYTQFLDENIEEERNSGIQAGLDQLLNCNELHVFFNDDTQTISAGMRMEIDYALKYKKIIRYFQLIDDRFEEIENKESFPNLLTYKEVMEKTIRDICIELVKQEEKEKVNEYVKMLRIEREFENIR